MDFDRDCEAVEDDDWTTVNVSRVVLMVGVAVSIGLNEMVKVSDTTDVTLLVSDEVFEVDALDVVLSETVWLEDTSDDGEPLDELSEIVVLSVKVIKVVLVALGS